VKASWFDAARWWLIGPGASDSSVLRRADRYIATLLLTLVVLATPLPVGAQPVCSGPPIECSVEVARLQFRITSLGLTVDPAGGLYASAGTCSVLHYPGSSATTTTWPMILAKLLP
jgi:hypothetical protein